MLILRASHPYFGTILMYFFCLVQSLGFSFYIVAFLFKLGGFYRTSILSFSKSLQMMFTISHNSFKHTPFIFL